MGCAIPILVTFVHGTFDSDAKWANEGSTICTELTSQFGERPLFTKFEWTGTNFQQDRQVAVNRLVDHIAAQSIYFPNSPHFLIGHSHGGNIILWAASQVIGARSTVSGIVTISTPFIDFKWRNFFPNIHALFFIWRTITTSFIILAWLGSLPYLYWNFIYFILYPAFKNIKPESGVLIVMILVTAPILLFYLAIRKFARRQEAAFVGFLKERQRWLIGKLPATVQELNAPCLCLYTKNDEVNIIFHGARFLITAWRFFDLALESWRNFYNKNLVGFLGLFRNSVYLLIGFVSFVVFIGNMGTQEVSLELFIKYGVPSLVLAVVIGLGIPITIAFGMFLQGQRKALDVFLLETSTSLRPTIKARIEMYAVSAGRPKGSRNIYAHSRILYSQEVATQISRFMAQTMEIQRAR